ncbi:hypothetical protein SEA_SPEEDDEMON_1630 [Gordonia phage SpeedDemon]|nr:hypothetical protein SEA_SPEEDDEMON_1630 [Gordonia phage SpeedDemon]
MQIFEPETVVGLQAAGVSVDDLEDMLRGYAEAHLWTHSDEMHEDYDPEVGGDPMLDATYDMDDIDAGVLTRWHEMLAEFVASCPLAVRLYRNAEHRGNGQWSWAELFGHDFLLTQDRHGAGFWDRGHGELGEYLTRMVQPYGESDYLWADNGRLVA